MKLDFCDFRPPPSIHVYTLVFLELRRIILKVFFVRDYASRGQIYHFIHLTLRLFVHPRKPRRGQMTFGHIR
jgi:hypothetical protein